MLKPKKRLSRKVQINVLVWWPVFVLLAAANWRGLEATQDLSEPLKWHFLFLGAVNCGLQVAILAGIEGGRPHRRCLAVDWALAFGLAAYIVYRLTDAFVFNMLGYHLTTAARFAFGNGLEQSIIMLKAAGVRPQNLQGHLVWLAAGLIGLTCLLKTALSSALMRLSVTVRFLGVTVAVLSAVLALYHLASSHNDTLAKVSEEAQRVLPFTLGWRRVPDRPALHGARLKPLPEEPARHARRQGKALFPNSNGKPDPEPSVIPKAGTGTGKAVRPDIFVFVVESLRGDAINAETTPWMHGFRLDALPVADSLAAGNATHLSWYSLFTGRHALRVGSAMARRTPWGSSGLRTLSESGYAIHVLAGTHLHYYWLDNILFGEHLELAASLLDERHMRHLDRPARDALVTERLIQKLAEAPGGRMFLVFYDSTHHDYYWPEREAPRFGPVTEGWNIYDTSFSPPRLEGIKNRYRSAVFYVDSLFGGAIAAIKKAGLYENSIIFLTGDHGEEFMEHGKLVHASEGCRVQTHVPWLLKLSAELPPPAGRDSAGLLVSHTDFLPTLLHYLRLPMLGGDGESIWCKWPGYAVVAEQNGGRDPYVFTVQDLRRKAWFQYRSWDAYPEIEDTIYLQKVTDTEDRPLYATAASPKALSRATELLQLAGPRLFPDFQASSRTTAEPVPPVPAVGGEPQNHPR